MAGGRVERRTSSESSGQEEGLEHKVFGDDGSKLHFRRDR